MTSAQDTSGIENRPLLDSWERPKSISYFALSVLGFSFWFFMAVPFATHRESYGWLAAVPVQGFAQQFVYGLSSTYRPLAQVVTWSGFRLLDPSLFPTSIARQALLQGFVYVMFLVAWWLIYSAAPQRRLFAATACITGGIFFSGYVHLFHIYGMFYVPVMLTLGALLVLYATGRFGAQEVMFASVATVLALWHPFATALFVGFYFGYYIETFRERGKAQHLQSALILLVPLAAIAVLVVLFPRTPMPAGTKWLGFLASYQTNEINRVGSFAAFLLAEMVVFSTPMSRAAKSMASLVVAILSVALLLKGLPLLFVWFALASLKLLRMRRWSIFFLMLTAAALPFGGGLGSPMYALFGIIVAAYSTSLGWEQGENALSSFKPQYATMLVAAAGVIVLLVRLGVHVPIVSAAASPLLAERERTYQLESILSWLHQSPYCAYDLSFAEAANSPVENVADAIDRRHRPPAALGDVQLFWNTVLRCPATESGDSKRGTATVTFGGTELPKSRSVFEKTGKYADTANVWVEDPRLVVQHTPSQR